MRYAAPNVSLFATDPSDPHYNPPLPAGLPYMADADVTAAMSAWAERSLADASMALHTTRGPRLLGGHAPVVAAKQWHPPDAQNGAWHYGVDLHLDVRGLPARGIDVSHYQGPAIDWEKVADDGVLFAYAKCTEGATIADDCFAANWAGAKHAGLLRGAYHFFRPASDPRQQVALFAGRLAADPGELPPAVDVESLTGALERGRALVAATDQHDGLAPDVVLATLAQVVLGVKLATSRRPLVYTAPGFWGLFPANGDRASVCAESELWVADWAATTLLAAGWQAWRFWQTRGDVPQAGVPGLADLDQFAGTPQQLVAYAAGTLPSPVPPPTPIPANVDLSSVRGWQMALSYASKRLADPALDPGGVDGQWGPHTTAATIAFCTRYAVADAGPRAQASMTSLLAQLRGS